MAATVLRECVEGKVTAIIDADTFNIQIDGESKERTVHQPAAVVNLLLSDNDRVIHCDIYTDHHRNEHVN